MRVSVKRSTFSRLGLVLLLCCLMAGCGGSKSGSNSPGGNGGNGSSGLQFTAPATSPALDEGQSISFTVNQPVTWSLQAKGNVQGTLTNKTSTSATYVAPVAGTLTSPDQVAVVATSTANPAQSATIAVDVNPAMTVLGSFSSNQSCQYDPTVGIGIPNGTAGVTYSNGGNLPHVTGGSAPYTWSVISGTLPAGLSLNWQPTPQPPSPSTAFLFGTPLSTGCSQVTVQIKDATGATAASTLNFMIIVPPPLKVQVPNYPDSYSGVPYPPTTISVSGGIPPYRAWSNGSAFLPPNMTITQSATNPAAAIISGVPTGFGDIANSGQVTVVDSQMPYPAVGSATLNIFQWPGLPANACMPAQSSLGGGAVTNPANLQGSYAFLLRGFDASGPVVMAGSFTADGSGNITGGVEDVMRTSGSQTAVAIASGSYSILQQNNSTNGIFEQSGCLALATSSGTTSFAISMGGCTIGVNSSTGSCNTNAQGTVGVYTTGRLIEFDDSTGTGTRASGIIRLQNSFQLEAGLNGMYAFGLSGWDFQGKRYAAAGSFTANSSNISSVAADVNDAGALNSALTGGSGSTTVDKTSGRGTLSLNVGSVSLSNLAVYVVSAHEALVASTGAPSATNPFVGGEAISTAGPFGVASLQNTHMFRTGGVASSGADPTIGVLQFDGNGSFTGAQFEDQAGTIGNTTLSGAYTVDKNTGRFLLAAPAQNQNVGDHPLVGYAIPVPASLTRQNCVVLASCVTGFLLSTDVTAQAGLLEFQTSNTPPPPPFSNLFVSGYYFYGTDETLSPATPLFAGAALTNPTGAHFTGIQSASYSNSNYCGQPGCVLLVPNETLTVSGAYSVNNQGIGSVGGETVAVTNGNVTFYIDESPLNQAPAVMVVEQ